MINIADIDPNFRIEASEKENMVYVSCLEGNVEINGLYKPLETGKLLRMPEEFTRNEEISEEARSLMSDTAGARIRFSTNALSYPLPSTRLISFFPIVTASALGTCAFTILSICSLFRTSFWLNSLSFEDLKNMISQ